MGGEVPQVHRPVLSLEILIVKSGYRFSGMIMLRQKIEWDDFRRKVIPFL
jgi:hypothetical protein